jgi:peptide/nickel transport system substrate-binding protein
MVSRTDGHHGATPWHRRTAFTLALAGIVILALSVGISTSGATPAKQSKTGAAGGTLTWAIQTSPASLFDAYYFSSEGSMIFSLVQDHILAPGTFGQPSTGAGSVVQTWKALSPTKYVYTIKKGIKFSDGSALTAADVAFSMNIHRNPKTGSKMGDFFGNVISIANKGNQVFVTLKNPDSNWQFTPAASPGLVYSQKDYKAKGANFGTPSGMPIGTGPYKFSEFTPNSRVVLVRNPYYTGKKYPWDKIIFPIIPDQQARLLALQSGQVDGTFAVPNNNIGTWLKVPNLKVGTYVSGGWRGFSIDVEDGPFQDVHVRRALAYSLNKADINEALASSRGVVLDGLPPLIFIKGLLPAAEVNAALKKVAKYPYSVDDAKAELAKSAYPKGFTTTLNVPADSAAATLLSQVLAQGASKIGITINLNMMPGPQRFQVILDHKPHLGIQVLGQAPDSPHPMQYLDLLYTSRHAQAGYENSANYKNPTVDKLIADGLASDDLKVAARNALKVMQITSVDLPYIPVFMFPGAWAVKSGWEFKSSIGPFYYNQLWLQHLVAK